MSETRGALQMNWATRWSLSMAAFMLALAIGACAASLWYVEYQGKRIIAAQEEQAAESELDLLVSIERDEGRPALLRDLTRRGEIYGRERRRLYALHDAQGQLVAGNLAAWPQELGDDEAWRAAGTDSDAPFHVATRALDDGGALLVGRDDADLSAFRHDILDAVWFAIAIVALTCLAAAAALAAFLLTRVRHLSDVAERVAEGDFKARAEGAEEAGPFGEIARAQNIMLGRIENLITGLKMVTDSLAHDLRTPLARTRRALEEGVAAVAPEDKQHALEEALIETDKTIATFTALIDIVRADGGLSREAMAPLDLGALIRDVYDLFEPMAEERRVTFTVQTATMPAMLGHRALLLQAVSNLAHNALKHAPECGHVSIAIANGAEGVDIIVADDGPGIAESERDHVVQRFRRSADAPPEGLGLGLAIVDSCARLHKGKLSLEDNKPGLRARLSLATH